MPLRPEFGQHNPDPRVARYHARVGKLLRGDEEVGLVLLLVRAYAEQCGGYWWWRRWGSTRDALWLWTIVDGRFSDHWVTDAVEEELDAYDNDRYWHYGEVLAVRWTDPEESAHLRKSAFGDS